MIKIYLGLLVAFALTSVFLPLQGLIGMLCITSVMLRKHKLDEDVLAKKLELTTRRQEQFILEVQTLLESDKVRAEERYQRLLHDVKLAQQEAKDRIASMAISKSFVQR